VLIFVRIEIKIEVIRKGQGVQVKVQKIESCLSYYRNCFLFLLGFPFLLNFFIMSRGTALLFFRFWFLTSDFMGIFVLADWIRLGLQQAPVIITPIGSVLDEFRQYVLGGRRGPILFVVMSGQLSPHLYL
jgi:hypothetical protein